MLFLAVPVVVVVPVVAVVPVVVVVPVATAAVVLALVAVVVPRVVEGFRVQRLAQEHGGPKNP